ncbi:MAG TPA: hypothetical protein GYA10_16985 [Alphaproteobacteria bacterium]|nr:hypothetical protein [Alphaproteobacteria bacterium]
MNNHPRALAIIVAGLAMPLPAAALADTLTVTDISMEGGGGWTLTVPRIEAVDSSLDEAAIRALFSTDASSTIARLATLDAASIRIPEITVSYRSPEGSEPATTRFTYRDVVLTDVADGVARGGASVGGMEMQGLPGSSFTLGRMSADLLDLGGILAFYGLGGAPQSGEMRPLYRNFVLDGAEFAEAGFRCTIGAATAAEFRARPLKHSFADLLAAAQELEAAETSNTPPSAATIAQLIGFYVDFLTAFESTPSRLDGLSCTGPADDGKTVSFGAGPLTIGAFAPGIYPSFALNDFGLEIADEGWLKFGNFTWKSMDLNPAIAALAEAGDSIDVGWFETNWRKLIPAIEGVSIADFSMDLPDEQGGPSGRIVAAIEGIDVTLRDYVNGIPTTISTKGTGIRLDVPEGPSGTELRALGLASLDLDFDFTARWDEAARTIALENVAVSGEDLGGIAIAARIGNAGAELFSDDLEVAQAAAMGLTLRELTIRVDNAGIAPTLIALAAADEDMAPDAFHLQLAGMARALPLAVLGATEEAIGLSEALGKFLEGTPTLVVTLTAVDPNGIGLAEFMAAQENPETLKGKFRVAAKAEGEPIPFEFPTLQASAPTGPQMEPVPQPAVPSEAPATAPSARAGEKNSSKN